MMQMIFKMKFASFSPPMSPSKPTLGSPPISLVGTFDIFMAQFVLYEGIFLWHRILLGSSDLLHTRNQNHTPIREILI